MFKRVANLPGFFKHHVMLSVNGYAVELPKLSELCPLWTGKNGIVVLQSGQLDEKFRSYFSGCRDIWNLGNFSLTVPNHKFSVKNDRKGIENLQAVSQNALPRFEKRIKDQDKLEKMFEEIGLSFNPNNFSEAKDVFTGWFLDSEAVEKMEIQKELKVVHVPAQIFNSVEKSMDVIVHSFFSDKAITGVFAKSECGDRVDRKIDYISGSAGYCSLVSNTKASKDFYSLVYQPDKVIALSQAVDYAVKIGGLGYEKTIEKIKSSVQENSFDSFAKATKKFLTQCEPDSLAQLEIISAFCIEAEMMCRKDNVSTDRFIQALLMLKDSIFCHLLKTDRVKRIIKKLSTTGRQEIDLRVSTSNFDPEETLFSIVSELKKLNIENIQQNYRKV